MRTLLGIPIILILLFSQVNAQDKNQIHSPLIGDIAPSFSAGSTKGTIRFPDDYYMKWKILFSHPADFTPVCSTELLELANMQDDFAKLNTKIVVVSTDGLESHAEWARSLEDIHYKDHPPVKIDFPMVSDKNLEVSKKYGMIRTDTGDVKDVRGVYIIDPENHIRAILIYPYNVGRNFDEIKRTLVALQTAENKNVLMPANWKPGQDVLIRPPKNSNSGTRPTQNDNEDVYSLSWFLWFKKLK
jgi:peroxiredoxin 2/4